MVLLELTDPSGLTRITPFTIIIYTGGKVRGAPQDCFFAIYCVKRHETCVVPAENRQHIYWEGEAS